MRLLRKSRLTVINASRVAGDNLGPLGLLAEGQHHLVRLPVTGVDPSNFSGSVDRLSRHLELLRKDHHVRLPAVELTWVPASV